MLRNTFIVLLALLSDLQMLYAERITPRQNPLTANIDWEDFLAQHDMYWNELTADPPGRSADNALKTGYYAGAIMGNGLLGTNLYKLKDNVYRLNIGRSDVTETRRPYNLFNSARLPIGYFTLTTCGNVNKESMRLSIYNAITDGIFTTDKGTVKFRTYVHAKEDYVVFETETTGEEADYVWNFVPLQAVSPRLMFGNRPPEDYVNAEGKSNPHPEIRQEGETHFVVQKLVSDTTFTRVNRVYVVAWREQRDGLRRRIIATVAQDKTERKALSAARSVIRKAFSESSARAETVHKEHWHAFYRKAAFLTFPDTELESFYWLQYYKFASTARPDAPIVDLQGVWPSWDTPWPAVWNNLNLQLTYSWQTKANLGFLSRPLWDALDRHAVNLRRNVTDISGQETWTDAACIGRTSSYDFHAPLSPELAATNQYEVGNLTWLLFYYHQYCQAYGETKRLKKKLFPLLKAAVNLYFHIRTEQDGRYGLPPTASPEYTVDKPIGPNANYDLANLRWALNTLIETDSVFNINDPRLTDWKDFRRWLVDYPCDAATGYKVSDTYRFDNTAHRYYSHLFMIYPYYLVNWEKESDRPLVEKSVKRWKGNQGYSLTGKAAMLLSMGKGEEALDQMKTFMKKYVKPNTLYAETGPVFETPMAAVSTLHDFYLQDWGNRIRVFHGMPSLWRDAAFSGLRAQGAFLVSASRRAGKTCLIRVESEKGGLCCLQTEIPADNVQVKTLSGKAVSFRRMLTGEGVIEIDMRPGDIVQITDKDILPLLPAPLPHPSDEVRCFGDGSRRSR